MANDEQNTLDPENFPSTNPEYSHWDEPADKQQRRDEARLAQPDNYQAPHQTKIEPEQAGDLRMYSVRPASPDDLRQQAAVRSLMLRGHYDSEGKPYTSMRDRFPMALQGMESNAAQRAYSYNSQIAYGLKDKQIFGTRPGVEKPHWANQVNPDQFRDASANANRVGAGRVDYSTTQRPYQSEYSGDAPSYAPAFGGLTHGGLQHNNPNAGKLPFSPSIWTTSPYREQYTTQWATNDRGKRLYPKYEQDPAVKAGGGWRGSGRGEEAYAEAEQAFQEGYLTKQEFEREKTRIHLQDMYSPMFNGHAMWKLGGDKAIRNPRQPTFDQVLQRQGQSPEGHYNAPAKDAWPGAITRNADGSPVMDKAGKPVTQGHNYYYDSQEELESAYAETRAGLAVDAQNRQARITRYGDIVRSIDGHNGIQATPEHQAAMQPYATSVGLAVARTDAADAGSSASALELMQRADQVANHLGGNAVDFSGALKTVAEQLDATHSTIDLVKVASEMGVADDIAAIITRRNQHQKLNADEKSQMFSQELAARLLGGQHDRTITDLIPQSTIDGNPVLAKAVAHAGDAAQAIEPMRSTEDVGSARWADKVNAASAHVDSKAGEGFGDNASTMGSGDDNPDAWLNGQTVKSMSEKDSPRMRLSNQAHDELKIEMAKYEAAGRKLQQGINPTTDARLQTRFNPETGALEHRAGDQKLTIDQRRDARDRQAFANITPGFDQTVDWVVSAANVGSNRMPSAGQIKGSTFERDGRPMTVDRNGNVVPLTTRRTQALQRTMQRYRNEHNDDVARAQNAGGIDDYEANNAVYGRNQKRWGNNTYHNDSWGGDLLPEMVKPDALELLIQGSQVGRSTAPATSQAYEYMKRFRANKLGTGAAYKDIGLGQVARLIADDRSRYGAKGLKGDLNAQKLLAHQEASDDEVIPGYAKQGKIVSPGEEYKSNRSNRLALRRERAEARARGESTEALDAAYRENRVQGSGLRRVVARMETDPEYRRQTMRVRDMQASQSNVTNDEAFRRRIGEIAGALGDNPSERELKTAYGAGIGVARTLYDAGRDQQATSLRMALTGSLINNLQRYDNGSVVREYAPRTITSKEALKAGYYDMFAFGGRDLQAMTDGERVLASVQRTKSARSLKGVRNTNGKLERITAIKNANDMQQLLAAKAKEQADFLGLGGVHGVLADRSVNTRTMIEKDLTMRVDNGRVNAREAIEGERPETMSNFKGFPNADIEGEHQTIAEHAKDMADKARLLIAQRASGVDYAKRASESMGRFDAFAERFPEVRQLVGTERTAENAEKLAKIQKTLKGDSSGLLEGLGHLSDAWTHQELEATHGLPAIGKMAAEASRAEQVRDFFNDDEKKVRFSTWLQASMGLLADQGRAGPIEVDTKNASTRSVSKIRENFINRLDGMNVQEATSTLHGLVSHFNDFEAQVPEDQRTDYASKANRAEQPVLTREDVAKTAELLGTSDRSLAVTFGQERVKQSRAKFAYGKGADLTDMTLNSLAEERAWKRSIDFPKNQSADTVANWYRNSSAFNDQQKEIINANPNGLTVIRAGAGAGKTASITGLIAGVLAGGDENTEVLATGFTKKAQKELRSNLYKQIKRSDRDQLTVSTLDADARKVYTAKRFDGPYSGELMASVIPGVRAHDWKEVGYGEGHEQLRTLSAGGDGKPNEVGAVLSDIISGYGEQGQKVFQSFKGGTNQQRLDTVQSQIREQMLEGHLGGSYLASLGEDATDQQKFVGQTMLQQARHYGRNGMADFDFIKAAATRLLEHPQIAEAYNVQNTVLALDESSHANAMDVRYSVARAGKGALVIGDDRQKTMLFRGVPMNTGRVFEEEWKGQVNAPIELNKIQRQGQAGVAFTNAMSGNNAQHIVDEVNGKERVRDGVVSYTPHKTFEDEMHGQFGLLQKLMAEDPEFLSQSKPVLMTAYNKDQVELIRKHADKLGIPFQRENQEWKPGHLVIDNLHQVQGGNYATTFALAMGEGSGNITHGGMDVPTPQQFSDAIANNRIDGDPEGYQRAAAAYVGLSRSNNTHITGTGKGPSRLIQPGLDAVAQLQGEAPTDNYTLAEALPRGTDFSDKATRGAITELNLQVASEMNRPEALTQHLDTLLPKDFEIPKGNEPILADQARRVVMEPSDWFKQLEQAHGDRLPLTLPSGDLMPTYTVGMNGFAAIALNTPPDDKFPGGREFLNELPPLDNDFYHLQIADPRYGVDQPISTGLVIQRKAVTPENANDPRVMRQFDVVAGEGQLPEKIALRSSDEVEVPHMEAPPMPSREVREFERDGVRTDSRFLVSGSVHDKANPWASAIGAFTNTAGQDIRKAALRQDRGQVHVVTTQEEYDKHVEAGAQEFDLSNTWWYNSEDRRKAPEGVELPYKAPETIAAENLANVAAKNQTYYGDGDFFRKLGGTLGSGQNAVVRVNEHQAPSMRAVLGRIDDRLTGADRAAGYTADPILEAEGTKGALGDIRSGGAMDKMLVGMLGGEDRRGGLAIPHVTDNNYVIATSGDEGLHPSSNEATATASAYRDTFLDRMSKLEKGQRLTVRTGGRKGSDLQAGEVAMELARQGHPIDLSLHLGADPDVHARMNGMNADERSLLRGQVDFAAQRGNVSITSKDATVKDGEIQGDLAAIRRGQIGDTLAHAGRLADEVVTSWDGTKGSTAGSLAVAQSLDIPIGNLRTDAAGFNPGTVDQEYLTKSLESAANSTKLGRDDSWKKALPTFDERGQRKAEREASTFAERREQAGIKSIPTSESKEASFVAPTERRARNSPASFKLRRPEQEMAAQIQEMQHASGMSAAEQNKVFQQVAAMAPMAARATLPEGRINNSLSSKGLRTPEGIQVRSPFEEGMGDDAAVAEMARRTFHEVGHDLIEQQSGSGKGRELLAEAWNHFKAAGVQSYDTDAYPTMGAQFHEAAADAMAFHMGLGGDKAPINPAFGKAMLDYYNYASPSMFKEYENGKPVVRSKSPFGDDKAIADYIRSLTPDDGKARRPASRGRGQTRAMEYDYNDNDFEMPDHQGHEDELHSFLGGQTGHFDDAPLIGEHESENLRDFLPEEAHEAMAAMAGTDSGAVRHATIGQEDFESFVRQGAGSVETSAMHGLASLNEGTLQIGRLTTAQGGRLDPAMAEQHGSTQRYVFGAASAKTPVDSDLSLAEHLSLLPHDEEEGISPALAIHYDPKKQQVSAAYGGDLNLMVQTPDGLIPAQEHLDSMKLSPIANAATELPNEVKQAPVKENRWAKEARRMYATLDERQQKAVDMSREGSVAVKAGAGSGKTRFAMTAMYQALADGVSPSQMSVISFANQSVDDIRKKMKDDLPEDLARTLFGGEDGKGGINIRTINSLAGNVIRDANPAVLDRVLTSTAGGGVSNKFKQNGFGIQDSSHGYRNRVNGQIVEKIPGDGGWDPGEDVLAMRSTINGMIERGEIDPQSKEYQQLVKQEKKKFNNKENQYQHEMDEFKVARGMVGWTNERMQEGYVGREYEQALQNVPDASPVDKLRARVMHQALRDSIANNKLPQEAVMRFGERVLKEHGSEKQLQDVRERTRVTVGEELQDNSRSQHDFLKTVVGDGTFIGVGDDRQDIYEWRKDEGSDGNFDKHLGLENRTVEFNRNYRSGGDVVAMANKIGDKQDQPTPDNKFRGSIAWNVAEGPTHQDRQENKSLQMAQDAFNLVQNDEYFAKNPHDIALIVQSHKQGKAVQEHLDRMFSEAGMEIKSRPKISDHKRNQMTLKSMQDQGIAIDDVPEEGTQEYEQFKAHRDTVDQQIAKEFNGPRIETIHGVKGGEYHAVLADVSTRGDIRRDIREGKDKTDPGVARKAKALANSVYTTITRSKSSDKHDGVLNLYSGPGDLAPQLEEPLRQLHEAGRLQGNARMPSAAGSGQVSSSSPRTTVNSRTSSTSKTSGSQALDPAYVDSNHQEVAKASREYAQAERDARYISQLPAGVVAPQHLDPGATATKSGKASENHAVEAPQGNAGPGFQGPVSVNVANVQALAQATSKELGKVLADTKWSTHSDMGDARSHFLAMGQAGFADAVNSVRGASADVRAAMPNQAAAALAAGDLFGPQAMRAMQGVFGSVPTSDYDRVRGAAVDNMNADQARGNPHTDGWKGNGTGGIGGTGGGGRGSNGGGDEEAEGKKGKGEFGRTLLRTMNSAAQVLRPLENDYEKELKASSDFNFLSTRAVEITGIGDVAGSQELAAQSEAVQGIGRTEVMAAKYYLNKEQLTKPGEQVSDQELMVRQNAVGTEMAKYAKMSGQDAGQATRSMVQLANYFSTGKDQVRPDQLANIIAGSRAAGGLADEGEIQTAVEMIAPFQQDRSTAGFAKSVALSQTLADYGVPADRGTRSLLQHMFDPDTVLATHMKSIHDERGREKNPQISQAELDSTFTHEGYWNQQRELTQMRHQVASAPAQQREFDVINALGPQGSGLDVLRRTGWGAGMSMQQQVQVAPAAALSNDQLAYRMQVRNLDLQERNLGRESKLIDIQERSGFRSIQMGRLGIQQEQASLGFASAGLAVKREQFEVQKEQNKLSLRSNELDISQMQLKGQYAPEMMDLQMKQSKLEFAAQKRELGFQQRELPLRQQQLDVSMQSQEANFKWQAEGIEFKKWYDTQMYGSVGADRSYRSYLATQGQGIADTRDAYHQDQHQQQAQQQVAQTPVMGLANEQFYAGIQHQMAQMQYGRTAFRSEAAYSENVQYLQKQTDFYERRMKIEDKAREFSYRQQEEQLEIARKGYEIDKQLLMIQKERLNGQVSDAEQLIPIQERLLDINHILEMAELAQLPERIAIELKKLGLARKDIALSEKATELSLKSEAAQIAASLKMIPLKLADLADQAEQLRLSVANQRDANKTQRANLGDEREQSNRQGELLGTKAEQLRRDRDLMTADSDLLANVLHSKEKAAKGERGTEDGRVMDILEEFLPGISKLIDKGMIKEGQMLTGNWSEPALQAIIAGFRNGTLDKHEKEAMEAQVKAYNGQTPWLDSNGKVTAVPAGTGSDIDKLFAELTANHALDLAELSKIREANQIIAGQTGAWSHSPVAGIEQVKGVAEKILAGMGVTGIGGQAAGVLDKTVDILQLGTSIKLLTSLLGKGAGATAVAGTAAEVATVATAGATAAAGAGGAGVTAMIASAAAAALPIILGGGALISIVDELGNALLSGGKKGGAISTAIASRFTGADAEGNAEYQGTQYGGKALNDWVHKNSPNNMQVSMAMGYLKHYEDGDKEYGDPFNQGMYNAWKNSDDMKEVIASVDAQKKAADHFGNGGGGGGGWNDPAPVKGGSDVGMNQSPDTKEMVVETTKNKEATKNVDKSVKDVDQSVVETRDEVKREQLELQKASRIADKHLTSSEAARKQQQTAQTSAERHAAAAQAAAKWQSAQLAEQTKTTAAQAKQIDAQTRATQKGTDTLNNQDKHLYLLVRAADLHNIILREGFQDLLKKITGNDEASKQLQADINSASRASAKAAAGAVKATPKGKQGRRVGGQVDDVEGSFAVGIKSVPHDMDARIHEGEAVLTVGEASAYRAALKESQKALPDAVAVAIDRAHTDAMPGKRIESAPATAANLPARGGDSYSVSLDQDIHVHGDVSDDTIERIKKEAKDGALEGVQEAIKKLLKR